MQLVCKVISQRGAGREKVMLGGIFIGQLLIAFAVLLNTARAQEHNAIVRGFVTDRRTGERLTAATIAIDDKPAAMSDKNGYFELPLSVGLHLIRGSMVGYEPDLKKIVVTNATGEITVFLRLEQKAVELGPISVLGSRSANQGGIRPMDFYKEDLQKIPQFAEADPLRAVQSLPGVTSATTDFNAQIYLRGGNFDETLIALDGVPLYNPYHLAGWLSIVNGDLIGVERLYRSNYPVNYGGHLSGALDLITKNGNQQHYKGSLSLGIPTIRGYIEGPLWKGSLILGARRTYLEVFTDVPYYFFDLFAKYEATPDNKNLFTASAFYSRDAFNPFIHGKGTNCVDVIQEPNWGNQAFQLAWTHLFGDNAQSEISAYSTGASVKVDGTKFRRDNYGLSDVNWARVANSIRELGLKLEGKLSRDQYSLLAGFEAKSQQLNYKWDIRWTAYSDQEEILFPKFESFYDYAENPFQYDAKEQLFSAYVSNRVEVTNRLIFDAGARLTYLYTLRKLLPLPYVRVEYALTPDVRVSGGYGRYFQNLYTMKENKSLDNMFTPYTVSFLADDEAKIAYSDHYVAGMELSLSETITCEMEGYYKRRKNLASSYNDVNNRYRFEDGYSAGVDLLVKKIGGNPSGWLGYSFLRSIKDNGAYKYFAHYDRTHSLKLFVNWNISESWSASALWTLASGVPYTPIIGKYVVTDYYWVQSELFPSWRPVEGTKNSARTNRYHRLDIGITGSFIWERTLIKPYFEVFNVYNSPNPYYHEFRKDEQRASNVVPTLGVTIEF
ncbi:MAG: TonB-dependent receptor [Bacteroidota bacterium]